MLRKSILMALICLFMAGTIAAQAEKPLPADKIMTDSFAKSKETNKNVMLLFHATWCSWCKFLDKAMLNEEVKGIFEKYFVITHLDVMEKTKEAIEKNENIGGKAIMNYLGGAKSGVPFYVFLTKDGESLANSNVMAKNGNIGYPGTFDEIVAFMKLIKTGAPKMTDAEAYTMFEFFKKNAPKSN